MRKKPSLPAGLQAKVASGEAKLPAAGEEVEEGAEAGAGGEAER